MATIKDILKSAEEFAEEHAKMIAEDYCNQEFERPQDGERWLDETLAGDSIVLDSRKGQVYLLGSASRGKDQTVLDALREDVQFCISVIEQQRQKDNELFNVSLTRKQIDQLEWAMRDHIEELINPDDYAVSESIMDILQRVLAAETDVNEEETE